MNSLKYFLRRFLHLLKEQKINCTLRVMFMAYDAILGMYERLLVIEIERVGRLEGRHNNGRGKR
jgi:hypothetical protein